MKNRLSINSSKKVKKTPIQITATITKTHKEPCIKFSNSERSDECIDFTMIITSRNNASISNFGGGFRCKSEYPWCIIQIKSSHFQQFSKKSRKTKKNDGKTGMSIKNFWMTQSFENLIQGSLGVFKFIRNLSKTRKFTIFLQEAIEKTHKIIIGKILSAISRRYLKILPCLFLIIQILTKNLAKKLKFWYIQAIKT
ncbi:Uncharacterized protein FWK35_00017706 [Aphis craccivora]|uniref:Uncharacterized protein n=1 Tax=Aphis craccivora TaxID=307492 RepID=A0A6G0Z1F7_APHCR|nr:Uncharacterized protein FWK35_00017706 [Aphis craccivora]